MSKCVIFLLKLLSVFLLGENLDFRDVLNLNFQSVSRFDLFLNSDTDINYWKNISYIVNPNHIRVGGGEVN